MSHEIDNSLGFNAFARAAGTEQAWHGLGQVVPEGATLEDWQRLTGTDWNCDVIPSQYMFNGEMMTSNNYHMVRSDTGASLGVMSERYKPVQPTQVWEFFRDFISADERFKLETGGALKGGKVIWALAKFSEQMIAAGDEHVPYVLLTTSYDGKLATTAQATMIRVVCNNTLTASIFSKDAAQVKVRHCTRWTEQVAADAHDKLAEVASQFSQYKTMADAMATVKMSQSLTEEFLKKVFLGPKANDEKVSTQATNQLSALFDAYRDTVTEGTQIGTAWTALNAVTRFVDHGRTTRDHSGEGAQASRMSSAFFGSGAALKQRAVDMLVEYAEDNGSDFASLLQKPASVGKGKLTIAA